MKFQLNILNDKFNKGILFLCGRNKSIVSFNVTNTGKVFNLEKQFQKRVRTCLIEFDETDLDGYLFFKTNNKLKESDPTVDSISNIINSVDIRWVVVASSMGAYFANLLPMDKIIGLILIDPISVMPIKECILPITVHLTTSSNSLFDRSKYHSHSKFIVHKNASHIIHWKRSEEIATSIKELLAKRCEPISVK